MLRWARTKIIYMIIIMLVAAAAISVGLLVTPDQEVSAAGQTIKVGVTGPSTHLSGPGELDLFGQQLDTKVHFVGPIRPRIQLTHITLSKQLKNFADSSSGTGAFTTLGDELMSGFLHFVYWQIAIVGVAAVLLAGAICGWMRRGWWRSLALIAAVLVVTEAINVGAIMVTAYSAPKKLSQVHSVQALVGDAPDLNVPVKDVPPSPGGSTVVIGDSTAAGLGNSPLPHPTKNDRACKRSVDAYAVVLSKIGDTPVKNLACSGATIRNGLLGPQTAGSVTLSSQLSQPAVASATTVIVSIGANDVRWSDQLLFCAVSVSCRNNAQQAVFQHDLAQFSADYVQLLAELHSLPNEPRVVINLYYDPFGDDIECLSEFGVTTEKTHAMLSKLDALNQVLASGAKATSFKLVKPDFSKHGLCSRAPFVQGVKSSAPFHPTRAGELAIALADEKVFGRSE